MTRLGFSRQLVATIRCCLLACLMALSMPLAATATSNDQQQGAKPIVSIEQLRQEAEAGNAKAQYTLGVTYVRGEIVSRDLVQAKIWLERAAAQDHGEADFRLGLYLAMGIWGKPNPEEAFRRIERSAKNGASGALTMLGNFYRDGYGTTQNIPLAIELLTKAANLGDGAAQYELGAMYMAGNGVLKDRIQARVWFVKAHEAGHADAAVMVAETYRSNDWKEHEAEIFKWVSIGARAGSLKGQKYLCDFYSYGVGTARDFKKAYEQCSLVANRYVEVQDPNAHLLENSSYSEEARKDNTKRIYDAAYWIATLLYNGEVVPRDCVAGRTWLTRVIEANTDTDITETRAKAMRYLALDYKHGCSVKQDDAEAKRLIDAAEALLKKRK